VGREEKKKRKEKHNPFESWSSGYLCDVNSLLLLRQRGGGERGRESSKKHSPFRLNIVRAPNRRNVRETEKKRRGGRPTSGNASSTISDHATSQLAKIERKRERGRGGKSVTPNELPKNIRPFIQAACKPAGGKRKKRTCRSRQ